MTKRQAAFFVNSSDANGVLLAARTATPKKAFVSRAVAICHFVNIFPSAMRAQRLIAPTLLFNEFHGRQFIGAGLWQSGDNFRLFEFWANEATLTFSGELLTA